MLCAKALQPSPRIPIYKPGCSRDDRRLKSSDNQSKRKTEMSRGKGYLTAMAMLAGALTFSSGLAAQTAPAPAPTENAAPTADNAVMITVFLKHDQSRPLGELNAQLDRQGYYKAFP